ncbi:MAG: hypothetical protein VW270_09230 [Candidatus Poseidoniales archaeon]
MKTYKEYLQGIYEPMTQEDIDALHEALDDGVDEQLLTEIRYLRSLLAEAYWWIGRKAPPNSSMPKRYRHLMQESNRIKTEIKEAKQ